MKDNVLKKEFNKKDVKRLRNLVKGKSSERTGQGVGYTKKDEFYEEGDTWEENGRMWTIRDGIKENITKLDKAKKARTLRMPGNYETVGSLLNAVSGIVKYDRELDYLDTVV